MGEAPRATPTAFSATVYALAMDGAALGAPPPEVADEADGEHERAASANPEPFTHAASITPEPTVLAQSVPSAAQLTEPEMVALLAEAGWEAALIPAALCTFWNESRWSPGAVSRTGDHGLAQINAATWSRTFDFARIHEPLYNLQAALVIYQRAGGWSPWYGRC